MPGGRPSEFSQEIADAICERLIDGESLRSICKSDEMPSKSTVIRWLADDRYERFRVQYAHAREAQAETFVDEICDIADDGSNDWMVRNNPNNPGWVENGEAISRSKLRVDTRKWAASKMAPKKYGEKITQELTGKDGGAIETKDLSGVDIARRLALLLTRPEAVTPQD
jgi:hypothetical protein